MSLLHRRNMLSTGEKAMEEYTLIHDTGEIEAETQNITIPLSRPLKKLYVMWRIRGNENTTTSNMNCYINGLQRFWTNGFGFQKNTTSGGVARIEEIADGYYHGYVGSKWNSGGFDVEINGMPVHLSNFKINEINRLSFGGGLFGIGSRIIVYGVYK